MRHVAHDALLEEGERVMAGPVSSPREVRALRWRRLGLLLSPAALIGAYAAFGYLAAPGLVRQVLISETRDAVHRSLKIGRVRVDPFAFTLKLDDVALDDRAQPLLTVRHIALRLNPGDALTGSLRLPTVSIDHPSLHLVMERDGVLNLTRLLATLPRASSNSLPAIRIDSFGLSSGEISYRDLRTDHGPRLLLAPIDVRGRQIDTAAAAGGAFALTAAARMGGWVRWSGDLSFAPIGSRGRLEAGGWDAKRLAPFVAGLAPFAVTSGQLSLGSDYSVRSDKTGLAINLHRPWVEATGTNLDHLALAPDDSLSLLLAHAALGSLSLRFGADGLAALEAGSPDVTLRGVVLRGDKVNAPTVRLNKASLQGGTLDLGRRRLNLDSVNLHGLHLPITRRADGGINLLALAPATASPPKTSPPSRPVGSESWSWSLGRLALDNSELSLVDASVSPPLHLHVAPLLVSATGISSDMSHPVALSLKAKANDGARVEISGPVIPANLSGKLNIHLAGLPLNAVARYAPGLSGLSVQSGLAEVDGQLGLKGTNLAAMTFRGSAQVDALSLFESAIGEPILAWKALALNGIAYQNGRLDISEGRLDGPAARIVILPGGTLNVATLDSAASPAPTAPLKPSAPISPPVPGPHISLGRLDIEDGSLGFADRSITPNFHAQIDAIAGAVTNISTAAGQAAGIDLQGQVIDRYSPVSIRGHMDLTDYTRHTDVHVAFRNIDLPIFDPYSDRYAGYAISKGKLTTEFDYRIDEGMLKANHHIVLDQLEWGKATASKQAVSWPVRLATALMKNSQGVIDLDIPVEGSLNDPKFELGPLIGQVMGNIVTQAISAPFRLIGGLFHGAEQAQVIDFSPGSSTLPAGAQASLAALAQALVQRPGLNVDIPAGPGTTADADAIAVSRLAVALNTRMGSDAATSRSRLSALVGLYREHYGTPPKLPSGISRESKAARAARLAQWLHTQLISTFAPSRSDLQQLGLDRAKAVRRALLASGAVDPDQVFVIVDSAAKSTPRGEAVELKLH